MVPACNMLDDTVWIIFFIPHKNLFSVGIASAIWVTKWLAPLQKGQRVSLSQWALQRWLPEKPPPGPHTSLPGQWKGMGNGQSHLCHTIVPPLKIEADTVQELVTMCVFSQGVLGSGHLQLPPLHAGSYGWQWLGLRLSLPPDHLLLVQAARLCRETCPHSQGDPTGTESE